MLLFDAAFYPLKQAADEGNAFAITRLALMFSMGKNAAMNQMLALELFEKAAANYEALHPDDRVTVFFGAAYENGRNGNFERSDYWFKECLKEMGKQSVFNWCPETLKAISTLVEIRQTQNVEQFS